MLEFKRHRPLLTTYNHSYTLVDFNLVWLWQSGVLATCETMSRTVRSVYSVADASCSGS